MRSPIPFLIDIKVHVHQARHHLALALAPARHVEIPRSLGDAEFLAAPEIGGRLGALNKVFARKARGVRARAADVFSLNDRHALALPRQIQAMNLPGSPLPSETRSYSSGCVVEVTIKCTKPESRSWLFASRRRKMKTRPAGGGVRGKSGVSLTPQLQPGVGSRQTGELFSTVSRPYRQAGFLFTAGEPCAPIPPASPTAPPRF